MKISIGQKMSYNRLTNSSVTISKGIVTGINFISQQVKVGNIWIDYTLLV